MGVTVSDSRFSVITWKKRCILADMKALCFSLILVFVVPLSTVKEERYDGEVRHFFTTALIAQTEKGFAEPEMEEGHVTPKEFASFLDQAYMNGYALVDPSETYVVEGGTAMRKSFSFPVDKKPLMLSFDDLVYPSEQSGKGMVDKLVVDGNKIGTVSTAGGALISYENECIPILESFIAKHPDFSPHGARGILFLTGREGIFGYRTQKDSVNRMSETERVKQIVTMLKEKGWKFGCMTYYHANMKKLSTKEMREELALWKNEVEPLVGETEYFSYPYGEWVLGEECQDNRHKQLEEFGYKVFFGVGAKPFYTRMPLKGEKRVLFMDRAPLDGKSLRERRTIYLPVFDTRLAYDPQRKIPMT